MSLSCAACSDQQEPLTTTAAITTDPVSASNPGSGSASGTGGETTGGSSEPTTGGPANTMEVCERYIQCVSVTTPNDLPTVQEGFGEGSACWSGGQDDADLCIQACRTGLAQTHELFPDEVKCYACFSDAECDQNAGERCLKGGCTLTNCGDGIVNEEELCDGQEGCGDDCQSGPRCNPITNLGCYPFETCARDFLFDEYDYTFRCEDYSQYANPIAGHGEGCGEDPQGSYWLCEPTLSCVDESAGDFNCDLDACCTPYCDLGAPACEANFNCVPWPNVFEYTLEPVFAYVGVCIP